MGSIFKIISFTKSFKYWYIGMAIFVVSISTLSLVTPFLSKQIVDLIVFQTTTKTINFSVLVPFLVLIIFSDIAITILTAISQWVGDLLAIRLQTFLASTFYAHLLQLDVGFYDNEVTGRLVNKMYRGIQSITDFIQSMLNNFLPFFLTALVTIIVLAFYSWVIALLLAILFPIYILISHGSTLAWRKFEEEKNHINDASQGRASESIGSIRLVKSFASEGAELAHFVTARHRIEKLTVTQSRGWHIYDFYRRISLNVILFSIYAYVVYRTFLGFFTIGEMTLLLQLVNSARFPLFAMSFILGQIQQASAGSKDFFALLETPVKIASLPQAPALKPELVSKAPMVEFTSVSFAYDHDKQVFKHISFAIAPGHKLALVGESGQGKSTLVNLLLRFYEANSGSIHISGQDISTVNLASLRQNIAVVFQESVLFSSSIKDNIRYGNPVATDEQVMDVARAANAHEFIKDLPQGYDSLVGERGVKLSGGQKQRIAIARAMLKDAPIIILDEATSSLDSKSEVLVQQGLNRLLHNRTSIIIAHRLSTISSADHILVLSGGSVAQFGTPKELLKDKKGLYYQLVTLQQELLKAPSEERTTRLKQFDLVG